MLERLLAMGQRHLETARFTVAVVHNPPHVEVLDAAAVPNNFKRTTVVIEVNKQAILEALRRGGEVVPGTEVARPDRLDIR
jgi:hypothetical protein